MTLAAKGYSVKDALCARRCPFVDRCAYLRQFGQEGDFFAATPLLKATSWWAGAGVVVLDEFDPTCLINHVHLDSADLAAMSRAHPQAPAVQAVLRWVALVLATTTDRSLSGALFLAALDRQAAHDGVCLRDHVATALAELPPATEQNLLPGLPNGATLADYQALPPSHTAALLNQIANEVQLLHAGRRVTSRIEARGGRLELYSRFEHLIEQLARADQPKVILDATANADLLSALFPATPVRVERPTLTGAMRVIQVVGRDWAKSSLKCRDLATADRRHARWVDDVVSHIRPGRKTLVVCTLEREEELRVALAERGHTDVLVAHYGALRGSNTYKGCDVILAQVYHPNLDAVVCEGRALFADDGELLDERIVVAPRLLRDATGATWRVQVPTFADSRLAALLEQRREAELLQCALRGRPFEHPDVPITLLFSLPIPGLTPTLIIEASQSAASNTGREAAVKARLCAAAQHLLDQGVRVIDVNRLARTAETSSVTTRKHWLHVAARLHLRSVTRRRSTTMPHGGVRHYERMVLIRRGRMAPSEVAPRIEAPTVTVAAGEGTSEAAACPMSDQARKKRSIARLIVHSRPLRRPCRARLRLTRRKRPWPPPDP
jgi:hypothetical protein